MILFVILVLLAPVSVQATIVLAWDCQAPCDSRAGFELTMQQGSSTQRFRVPVSAPGACPGEPAETFCTQVPVCPAPGGTVQFTVATPSSPPSNTVSCQVTGTCTCMQEAIAQGSAGGIQGQGAVGPSQSESPPSTPGQALPPGTMLIDLNPSPPPPDVLPPLLTPPSLPLFQPAASQAPV